MLYYAKRCVVAYAIDIAAAMSPSGPTGSQNQNCSIAVVGMAGIFPGATNIEAMWNLLYNGQTTVSEVRFNNYSVHCKLSYLKVPPQRFSLRGHRSGAESPTGDAQKLRGNFIDQPDVFDNTFFHVSPREAHSMDPQQRLLLHTAYHALENAGYIPNATPSWNPDSFGTFVGVATNDYVHNLRDNIDVYYSTGMYRFFVSLALH